MNLFHRTFASEAILRGGFQDREGGYLIQGLHSGVWLSDRPLGINEGADGDVVLVVEIPETEVARFEWTEAGMPYREFLVPTAVVNRFGPPAICDEEHGVWIPLDEPMIVKPADDQ